jgi:hypothetical protein
MFDMLAENEWPLCKDEAMDMVHFYGQDYPVMASMYWDRTIMAAFLSGDMP